MSKEVFPGDSLALQSSSLSRPLRWSLLFFWVFGAVVIDYFCDAIGVWFSVPGGAPAAVGRSRYCLLIPVCFLSIGGILLVGDRNRNK